jgi:hypothetical protein
VQRRKDAKGKTGRLVMGLESKADFPHPLIPIPIISQSPNLFSLSPSSFPSSLRLCVFAPLRFRFSSPDYLAISNA